MALEGLPFDERRNVIPHEDGRVVADGDVVPGFYVAGWIKRGPTGIIGTNKKDAVATVDSLLADARAGSLPTPQHPGGLEDALRGQGVSIVSTAGWDAIDAAERALGATRGRDRTTLHDHVDLLAAADAG
jgi:ferredoxin--NADP+ reductase